MSWPTKKLGDPEICTIIMGQSPPSSSYNKNGGGLPFYQGKKDFGSLYPTPSVWCSVPAKMAEANDILISVRAPVGPVNLCEEKSAIGRGLAILRPNKNNLDYHFLFLFLKSIENKWNIFGGAVFAAITKTDLQNLASPFPPIAEQRKIVAKIEKLFAKIDEASRLRAESSASSAALLPSALHQIFSRAEKERWNVKKLDEVAEFLDSQRRPINEKERKWRIASKKQEDLYPYYGANGQIGWIDDYIFDEELVLLAEDGGFFGSTSRPIAYRVSGKCWVNNHAHVLRPRRGVLVDWLYYMLKIRPDVGDIVRGATRAKLNQAQAKEIKIPLPPVVEQKKIVAYLDSLSQKSRELQNLQSQTAADFSALRQSALTKASTGGL